MRGNVPDGGVAQMGACHRLLVRSWRVVGIHQCCGDRRHKVWVACYVPGLPLAAPLARPKSSSSVKELKGKSIGVGGVGLRCDERKL